jgi:hypothetical protein
MQEMLLQIAAEYPGLPDVRTLSTHEIRFFYSGLVPGILRMQEDENKRGEAE